MPDDLKRLAEAAKAYGKTTRATKREYQRLMRPFIAAASPDVVLGLLAERDEALKSEKTWRGLLDDAQTDVKMLREALENMLLSADALWEEQDDHGHDWSTACEAARALLARATTRLEDM